MWPFGKRKRKKSGAPSSDQQWLEFLQTAEHGDQPAAGHAPEQSVHPGPARHGEALGGHAPAHSDSPASHQGAQVHHKKQHNRGHAVPRRNNMSHVSHGQQPQYMMMPQLEEHHGGEKDFKLFLFIGWVFMFLVFLLMVGLAIFRQWIPPDVQVSTVSATSIVNTFIESLPRIGATIAVFAGIAVTYSRINDRNRLSRTLWFVVLFCELSLPFVLFFKGDPQTDPLIIMIVGLVATGTTGLCILASAVLTEVWTIEGRDDPGYEGNNQHPSEVFLLSILMELWGYIVYGWFAHIEVITFIIQMIGHVQITAIGTPTP